MQHLERIYNLPFGSIYQAYIAKATKKNRSEAEVIQIICWLLGYTQTELQKAIDTQVTLREFFNQKPQLHPHAIKITGSICGYKIQEIEDPLLKEIRYLDKLIDELAKGRPMDKILRP